jgi:hypothetical protein
MSPAARRKPPTSNPRETKGGQILDAVALRAATDTNFRRRLLDDPKAVLAKEGLQISDDVEVVVHRNRPGVINLVLPAGPLDKAPKIPADEVDIGIITLGFGF